MRAPTPESWSPDDHLRHFAYAGIAAGVEAWKSTRLVPSPARVLDFGAEWYGDPDGGWQTYARWMLKTMIAPIAHVLATYPPHDAQAMPEFGDATFDVVVVDNVLEHVERPWDVAAEARRVLRPGGLAIAMTPGLYPVHRSPLDCWRIFPDGYRALFPAALWDTLACDAWGSLERLLYELKYNGAFPDGPPETTVERALEEDRARWDDADGRVVGSFAPGFDGRFPIMVWWVGARR